MAKRKSSIIDVTLTATDKMSAKLEGVTKSIEAHEKTWKRTSKKIAKYGRSIEKTGKSLTKSLTVPIVGAGVAAVKLAAEFEQSMATVAATSGIQIGSDAYNKLSEAALEAGKNTNKSATEAAEALNYMALAGWSVEDSTQALTSMIKMSSATGADLATTSDLITDSMSAAGIQMKDYESYMSMIAQANDSSNASAMQFMEAMIKAGGSARALGVDLNDVGTALGILANNGKKGSEAGTMLNSVFARWGGNDKAISAFKKLGVELYKMENGKQVFRGLNEVLTDTQKALQGYSLEEQMMIKKQIAGTNYFSQFNYLLEAQGKEWDSLSGTLEEAYTNQDALNTMYDTATDTLQGTMDKLKSAVQTAIIAFGERLKPHVKKAIELVQKLADWFNNLSDEQIDMAIKIAAVVAAIGPALVIVGKVIAFVPKLVAGFKAVATAIKFVSGAMSFLAANPVVLIIGAVIAIIAVLAIVIYKNWDKIKAVIDKAVAWVKSAWEKVKEAFSSAISRIKVIISNVVNWFKTVYGNIKAAIDNVIGKVKDFKDKVVSWVQTVKDKVTAALQPMIDKFNLIKDSITTVIEKLKNSKLVKWMSGNYEIGENASGTNYWRGGLTRVNEEGGEIMNLPRGTQIIPHDESLKKAYQMGKASVPSTATKVGGTTVTIPKIADTIVVREDADIDRIADALAKKLSQVSANYGVAV